VTRSNQVASVDVPQILDTQIVSYAMKDRWPEGMEPQKVADSAISSVTALELLKARPQGASDRPPYYLYPPLLAELAGDDEVMRKWDRDHRGKAWLTARNRTDQVVLDFDSDLPVVIEYGHLMVGWLLKQKRPDVFARRITRLDKKERHRLMEIFYYLTENNLRCFSLDRSVAQTSIDLLRQYAMSGNNLKADFRNSLNDMMILATSINSGTNLLTEDRALWSFAARVLSLPLNAKGPLVLLETSSQRAKSAVSTESKGYVNRPWEARNCAIRAIGGTAPWYPCR
jgi:predicted nucleic acid-binding protein